MELSVPVDGGHLWADDTGGDGPVLVLLHPGWGDSSIWLPVLERLPPHYRVIRHDTRGFGKSPAQRHRSARWTTWTAPVILEALIPGRMQSHASTAEVPPRAARARGEDGARG